MSCSIVSSSEEMSLVVNAKYKAKIPEGLPQDEPTEFKTDPTSYLANLTSTTEGEASLARALSTINSHSPEWHRSLANKLVELLKEGLKKITAGDSDVSPSTVLAKRPLIQAIQALTSSVMVPRPDNFTPPERTPWGGYLIRSLMRDIGVPQGDIVGEAWVISGHPQFPNKFVFDYDGYLVEIPSWFIGRILPESFYGVENIRHFGDEPPFLTKLLNSGSWEESRQELRPLLGQLDGSSFGRELRDSLGVSLLVQILDLDNHGLHRKLMDIANTAGQWTDTSSMGIISEIHRIHLEMIAKNLSIQIHPADEYIQSKSRSLKRGPTEWHSKTEMWVVLKAEEGAGLYLGLKEGVTAEEMKRAMASGEDVSNLLNFVEVKKGDIFYIPAGTPHAISAGILLLEQQETSETTFRYFSWWDGRELHQLHAVQSTNFDTERGERFIERHLRRLPIKIDGGRHGMALHENLATGDRFSYDRITFNGLEEHEGNAAKGMHGLTVIEGSVELYSDKSEPLGRFRQGQSFIIPAAMGRYRLVASKGSTHCVVFVGRSDPREIKLVT